MKKLFIIFFISCFLGQFTSAQNVGIGVTAPSQKFDVAGLPDLIGAVPVSAGIPATGATGKSARHINIILMTD